MPLLRVVLLLVVLLGAAVAQEQEIISQSAVDKYWHDRLFADDTNASKGECEICIYVLELKEQHKHPLCSSLKNSVQSDFYDTCVQTLEGLLMYDRWYVWWVYAGCIKRNEMGQLEKIRPCPAHAVCSWIYNPSSRRPFCPTDTHFHPGV
eukprot:gnl/Hemi2/21520_TR7164_c0_g2_i1.p1 gnl/Hemi2/21520_TR7164_c0_g2~~gnl/Hemi2/21520_TR7164_c0_g2_i1.p1  ORF type:complete len:150 (+),score=53.63 gnl/Hemi2/21520_TR7164_c0_g2_i1:343-792(+)